MSAFTIYPAIDLRSGQVVRLKMGDPEQQTTYASQPGQVARRWLEAGARWLHVVNLDGAFGEHSEANRRALDAILTAAAQAGARVQFGGGLRSLEAIQAALEAGVQRVVLGTLAIEQPEVLGEALARWGSERVAVSLDARQGLVQVRGWQDGTGVPAEQAAAALARAGLRWLVHTDIARDGLQNGPNLAATRAVAQSSGLQVIASGGVAGLADVRASQESGLAGVIVGRALYEGSIDPVQLFKSLPTAKELPC